MNVTSTRLAYGLAALSLLALIATALIVAWSRTGYVRSPCDEMRATPRAAAASDTPADTKAPKVARVFPRGGDVDGKVVGFRAPICVEVENLKSRSDQGTLLLYLGGEKMTKIPGRVVDPAKGYVAFNLTPAAEDMDAWRRVIGFAEAIVPMAVGVGTDKVEFDRADDVKVEFLLFTAAAMFSGLFAALCALAALAIVARYTGLLRDAGASTSFSLARCQMALWLVLITGSFIYIWFVTGEYNGIVTTDALMLLGISATTGLAAVAMGTPQNVVAATSEGMLSDLMNDGTGPTLHRIQIVIWTLLLAAVFLWQVYATFRFPKFDLNLLIMMGISGGFYLGFKAKEK
jgi:hypothetical protein